MMYWEEISASLIMISLIFSLIVYMLSKLLSSTELENIAKKELIFVVSSMFILAFFLLVFDQADKFIFEILKSVSEQVIGKELNVDSMPELASVFTEQSFDCMKSFANMIYLYDMVVAPVTHLTVDQAMGNGAGVGGGLKFYSGLANNLLKLFALLSLAYYMFEHLIYMFYYFAPVYLIPAGIALRVFPPTRAVGAYLLSFALAFGLILPAGFIFTSIYFYNNMFNCGVGHILSNDVLDNLVCEETASNNAVSTYQLINLRKDELFENTETSGLSWAAGESYLAKFFVNYVYQPLINLSMRVCFVPYLTLAITMTALLSGSMLFGADMPELGRGLAKFI